MCNYPAALYRHRLHTLLQYVKIQYVKIIERQLQEKVLDMLYNILTTHGYLSLGEVEILISRLREKVGCLDNKARV